MFRYSVQTRKGFTLVEILTVFMILTVVGYSLSLMFKQATDSYSTIKASQEIVDTERSIIAAMSRDIQNAYISETDPRFRFIASDSQLNFNAFREHSAGYGEIVEIGYSYDGAGNRIMRRIASGPVIPDADVTAGGSPEPLGGNVQSLSFRIGYKGAAGTVEYVSGSSTWDSRNERFPNYNAAGAEKIPDGLPHLIEITFALTDSRGVYPQQTITTAVYLSQDN